MTSIEHILKNNISYQQTQELDDFLACFKELYKIKIFKIGLDVILTKCEMGLVKFIIADKDLHGLDGCCITEKDTVFNKYFGAFVKRNKYLIRLKKLNVEVLAHEITHALESESRVILESDFKDVFLADLENIGSTHLLLKNAIKQILFKEISLYKEAQHNSEYLARFFELLARSKEVGGYSESYKFRLNEIESLFENTIYWINTRFNESLKAQQSEHISAMTMHIEFQETINYFSRKEQKKFDNNEKWRGATGSIFGKKPEN
jgi:hypothetical protein